MKKLVLYISIFLTANIYAQSIFDKYEDMDDVTSVIVTDEMFKMISSIEPEGQEAKEEISVLKDLNGLKVFSTDNYNIAKSISSDVTAYVKKKSMKELMRINDNDAKVKFFVVKGDKEYIAKELVMILSGKNGNNSMVVMELKGNIDLRKLSKLNKKVKIVNKKYLEEVEKKMNEN